jgi:putative transposase
MTESSMTLGEYLRKISVDLDGDFLREGVHLLAQLIVEGGVTEQIGASKYQRTPNRKTQRNGYREPRDWDTRVGPIGLAIPKLREGSYFPSFLGPRRRAEKALLAVVQ